MTLPPPTERQARLFWLALSGLAIAILAGLTVALIWGLGQVVRLLSPVLWPLAVAGVIAYLLDPLVDHLERRGARRSRAIVAVFAMALLAVAAFFGSIVPQLVTEARQLVDRVPDYATRLSERVERLIEHPPQWVQRFLEREATPVPPTLPTTTTIATDENAPGGLTNAAPDTLNAVTNRPPSLVGALSREDLQTAAGGLVSAARGAGSWLFGRVLSGFGLLIGLALIPVYTFYFLLEKHGISSRWTNYLPVADSRFKNELVFVLQSINNYLIAFFRGQVLVALCDGILYGFGFLVVGLPYAVLIGFMAIFLTMIPFLGATIICIAALTIALVQFGDWLHPLLVLVVFGCVQALESLFISPRVMGGRVGLHPVTIIIAVMVGTTLLGGLLGGILAIPLTAALRVVMFRYVWKRPTGMSEPAATAPVGATK
jgi:predicted PurR-regulated permease PerM